MGLRPRTVQEGKIMLVARNSGRPDAPREETWAVVPPELKLKEGSVVDILGFNYVNWDKTQVWVLARWRPDDPEPVQFMCERFDRSFFLAQMVAEEFFPIGKHLYDARKILRVRDKETIRKIDEVYRWREDDDKVWCSPTAQDRPWFPTVKPHLSLRKRLKLAGRDEE